jgi:uncharacterized protein involved in propanediol utilization
MTREARVFGHFGEWLQGRLGPNGPLALVTVPCPALCVTARLRPSPALTITGPAANILTTKRALRMLQELGLTATGRVTLAADMPAGGGAGASTAALVALALAAGAEVSPERMAEACLLAEGATDPLMLDAPHGELWAPREARGLGSLPAPPVFEIVGGFFGSPTETDPADLHFADVSDLIDPWRRAAACGNHAAISEIATTSAERTTKLRGPSDDPTPDLVKRCGALGHLRAHTGSARALLFAGSAPPEAERVLCEAGFRGVLRFRTVGSG